MAFTFTILGCGSSGGVPRIGGGWGACDPANPRNRRRRASALLERRGAGGVTRVLIDTSPDLREQMLDAGVDRVDAVLFTHDHADHTHGIDDLRVMALLQKRRVPVHMDDVTARTLTGRFAYCFERAPGSSYPPILDLNRIEAGTPCTIAGAGGSVTVLPVRLEHGDIPALGFRIGGLAYAPDVSGAPPEARAQLAGLEVLVLNCLRYHPHPSHLTVEQALALIADLRPGRAILTHLHIDLDYDRLAAELPEGIIPAHDGMVVELDLVT
jgi:phosphoribosyl 1,2-cyclic phosphate phosphodiesterase